MIGHRTQALGRVYEIAPPFTDPPYCNAADPRQERAGTWDYEIRPHLVLEAFGNSRQVKKQVKVNSRFDVQPAIRKCVWLVHGLNNMDAAAQNPIICSDRVDQFAQCLSKCMVHSNILTLNPVGNEAWNCIN